MKLAAIVILSLSIILGLLYLVLATRWINSSKFSNEFKSRLVKDRYEIIAGIVIAFIAIVVVTPM